MINFQEVGRIALGALGGFQHQRHVLGLGAQFNRVLGGDVIGGDGDLAAIDAHMAMADQLAGSEGRRHEFAAIDDGVETGFQQADHVLARVAGTARSVGVIFAELALGDVAVIALELLLGLKLGAIVGKLLGAALAVLARTIGALVDRALGTAPDILAHTAIELVLGKGALGHWSSKKWRQCRKGRAQYSAPTACQTATTQG